MGRLIAGNCEKFVEIVASVVTINGFEHIPLLRIDGDSFLSSFIK